MNTKSTILHNALQSYYLKLITEEYDVSHEKETVAKLLNYLQDNGEITEQWLKCYIRIINKSIKCYKNQLLNDIENAKISNNTDDLNKFRQELNTLNNYFLNK